MSEQNTAAAERSAHVTRGPADQPKRPDPFVGPEFGPIRLRCVADLEAERDAARGERDAAMALIDEARKLLVASGGRLRVRDWHTAIAALDEARALLTKAPRDAG